MPLILFYLVFSFLLLADFPAAENRAEATLNTVRAKCIVIRESGEEIRLLKQSDLCPDFFLSSNLLIEGSPWNHPETLRLLNSDYLIIDMNQEVSLNSILLQRDHNDTYKICTPLSQVSANLEIIVSVNQPEYISFSKGLLGWPEKWRCFITVSPSPWVGLRTHIELLNHTVSGRFFLIHASGGDELWSVSRLLLGEEKASAWTPLIKIGPVLTPYVKKRLEREARIIGLFVVVFILIVCMGQTYAYFRYPAGEPVGIFLPMLSLVTLVFIYWWPLWSYLSG